MEAKPLQQAAMEFVREIGPDNLGELIELLQREQAHPGTLADHFTKPRVNGSAESPPQAESEPTVYLPPRLNVDWLALMRWLRENRQAYGGQWVALDGDHLIAHAATAAEVYAAAAEAGVSLPFVTYLEQADALLPISPYAIYS